MAVKTAKAAEVLPAPLPEQGLVQADSLTIVGFLNGLVPFFRTATDLELKGKATLEQARAFTLPKPGDVDGDAALQTFIRQASADRKTVEKHWEITSLIHGFHKKLVAARARVCGDATDRTAGGYLVEAQAIAQRLHNTFVEDAKRRALAEQQRVQREAEAAAQAARDAELQRMEAAALEHEAGSADLSEREREFVMRCTNGGNTPAAAARYAGYKDPEKAVARLMVAPKIAAAIKAVKDAAEIRRQAAAVKEAPIAVETTVVKAQVSRVGSDRTTWGAEAFDPDALLAAALDPLTRTKLGIPADVLMVNPVKLNDYGKQLHEKIDTWPGVRHTKKTTTV